MANTLVTALIKVSGVLKFSNKVAYRVFSSTMLPQSESSTF